MLGTMMRFPLTLSAMLEHAGKLHGEVEIVSRLPDKSLHRHRYADLYRRAHRLAEALAKAGLKRGERVATLMWNHYAHVEAYFGIPAAGGVFHTLNLRLSPDDIAYIANHAGDRFLIVDDVLLPLYERFRDKVKLERVFVVSLTGKPIPQGYEDYEAFLKTASGDFRFPELDENEACGMCYTSGTTGRPKGVAYSHRSMVLHTMAISLPDVLNFSMRQTLAPVVPMFHANAWGIPFGAVLTGAKLVMPGPHLDAESLLDLFSREGVTCAGGVPSIWLGVLDLLRRERAKYPLPPNMRLLVGGSACPEAMLRAFDELGITIIHAWGMTEMSPVGTMGTIKPRLDQADADTRYAYRAKQGIALPFVEVRVINDEGEAPWDGESVGELQVRGPWVAASYYNPEEKSKTWTEDGWLRTGDVVNIDAEGYIKITDRTKDLIKSGGEWISSVDLENALMGHPAVLEAAVIAIPHAKWQERPLACVVLKKGASATAAELKDFLATKFANWWLPDAIEFVDEIPKTTTGKFQKTRLREQFKDYRLAS
ncbi:MAG TPA: long-chain fatty acid--CoA ligase [Alphaproteobacteria bacterium]|nr:long-chain fatty acid--CoA ligase [Alphaproteobacteria bacterium]